MIRREDLPYVYTAEELISLFTAAYFREEARGSSAEPAMARRRRLEIRRIVESGKELSQVLRSMALRLPFQRDLHPFYAELLDLLYGADRYRTAVARLANAPRAIRAIAKEAVAAVRAAAGPGDMARARRMYLGRVADLLRDMGPQLEDLRRLVATLRRLPSVDPSLFTVVVAGAPNVGKSSFVRCVSTGRPEVAEYPFTTKQIHLGHIALRGDRVQVVDTPGLLDRPLSERNKIELQAILALRHLAHVVAFIVDPTPHSGYGLDMQETLYNEIRQSLGAPVVALVNKADIASEEELAEAQRRFSPLAVMSTAECRGTAEAMEKILHQYYVPYGLRRLRAEAR